MDSQTLVLPVNLPELDVPAGYLSVIPSLSVHAPVGRFRFHVLQERRGVLVFPTASTSFSVSHPSATYNPSVLASDPIPSSGHLHHLNQHLAHLSETDQLAIRSVRNPARGEEFLPLWVITVWNEVSALRDSRDMWNNAYSWIERVQATREHSDHTRVASAHFKTLGWNAPILCYELKGVTTLALPQFLSDNCINDEAIDLMVHFLTSTNILPPDVLISQLSLSNFIASINTEDALLPPSPSHIQQIERQLSHASALYFVLFYAQHHHWIAFKVDISRREITYSTSCCRSFLFVCINASSGDSMQNSLPKPAAFIKNLLFWLDVKCGSGFKFCGRKLVSGSQQDSTSCGFFAVNSISHAVFEEQLLQHQDIRSHRLKWFNRLCTTVGNQVSLLTYRSTNINLCHPKNLAEIGYNDDSCDESGDSSHNHEGQSDPPPSPTILSTFNTLAKTPLALSPALPLVPVSTLDLPTSVPSEPLLPPNRTPRNTLHTFFNISHQPTSVPNQTPSTIK